MADKPKVTLYHSELVQMGPIRVKIKSDVTASKFDGKPNYVIMEIDGQKRNYNCENPDCEDALDKMSGRTVMLEATGSREEASIKILGAGAEPEPPHDKDTRQTHPPMQVRRPAGRSDLPPPHHDHGEPQEPQPRKEQTQNRRRTPMGQTVGMALNNACANLTARQQPLDPKEVAAIASDILRLSYWLEEGNLLPTYAHREAMRTKAPQAQSLATTAPLPQPTQTAPTPPPASAAVPMCSNCGKPLVDGTCNNEDCIPF